MLFLLKYWRYIALVLAVLAVFAWHKNECSKAYDDGVRDQQAATAKATEELRVRMQAQIDEAESKSATVITKVETEIKVVDREVIKKVFVECPDTFSEYKRLLNDYIRTGSSQDSN